MMELSPALLPAAHTRRESTGAHFTNLRLHPCGVTICEGFTWSRAEPCGVWARFWTGAGERQPQPSEFTAVFIRCTAQAGVHGEVEMNGAEASFWGDSVSQGQSRALRSPQVCWPVPWLLCFPVPQSERLSKGKGGSGCCWSSSFTHIHRHPQLPACSPLLLDFPSRRCLKSIEVYLPLIVLNLF